MAKKTKLTRRELHNEKRASRFEAAGVRVDRIEGAKASCEGRQDDGAECTLCGHGIKWLFKLALTLSGGQVVTFSPVGSQCIVDWAEALPVSEAQRKVLATVKVAEKDKRRMQAEARKLKAAMQRRNATIKYLSENGDEDGAKLMDRYFAATQAVQDDATLKDIASRTIRFQRFASDKQRGFFAATLNKAQGKGSGRIKVTVTSKDSPQAANEAPQETREDPDAILVARALELLEAGAEDVMHNGRGNTMRDIAGKGEQWGLSDGQRRFLQDLVREADELVGVEGAPVLTTAPVTVDTNEEFDVPF